MSDLVTEGAKGLHTESLRSFTIDEQATWTQLFTSLHGVRKEMAWSGFNAALDELEMGGDQIPDLQNINHILQKKTGWRGVPVNGLEDGYSFYPALARREFPIGNFIRDGKSLGYTPAPDIFHDLYGHIPFFMDADYADFCFRYGVLASRYLNNVPKLKMYERFFWFCVEFPLVETLVGRKIFGAGIISSLVESIYSLSEKPKTLPFDIRTICLQDYRIDQIQPILFVLRSPAQLYHCLPDLEETINILAS